MARNKTLIPLVAALVIVVVCAAAGVWVAQSRDAWFVRTMLDRAVPWQQPDICYAPTPDAESYFQIYDDAAGAYENYVYEIKAEDAEGAARRVVLVSFGTMLDENKPYVKMRVKGSSVCAWEYADAPGD